MIQISLLSRVVYVTCILMLGGCGGASDTQSSASVSTPNTQITDPQRKEAARLLTQASFGPRANEIEQVAEFLANNNVTAWIDAQVNKPITLHYPVAEQLSSDNEVLSGASDRPMRMDAWWRASLLGEDQLRQRIAFALSQLFVISENSQLGNFQIEIANYYDLLLGHAFGNYRELMEDVTKSPVMGLYLSMMGNEKPQPDLNIRPDENFARELMQLFTIGLNEMNIDGSLKLDLQGQAIPTYNQETIEAYAHVFTGWHFAGKTELNWNLFFANYDFLTPMELVDSFHDQDSKILLNGYMVPSGTQGETALDIALDSLFMHPNMPPFVAKHMIQHLVTSNPSSEYVARVASAFEDNGEGVRGNMLAVVTAVMIDSEAREPEYYSQAHYGKVKQPLIRTTQILRALIPEQVVVTEDELLFRELVSIQDFTAQSPLGAPSVFNFFLPDHQVNGELLSLGMVTPEFQIITTNNVVRNSNFFAYFLYSTQGKHFRERLNIDFTAYELKLDDNIEALIAHINFMLLQGNMSDDYAQVLRDYDNQIAGVVTENERIRETLMLVFTSPQFAVQQ